MKKDPSDMNPEEFLQYCDDINSCKRKVDYKPDVHWQRHLDESRKFNVTAGCIFLGIICMMIIIGIITYDCSYCVNLIEV